MKFYDGEGQERLEITTEISENSTDAQIPSAKVVYDYVDEVIGGIENGSY